MDPSKKGVREEYVDAEVNGERVEEEYEEFPEPTPAPPLPTRMAPTEDYVNLSLPYSELRTMTQKCGPLWRKDRFIFLEQWRRCWAGLYGHAVLLYSSERDVKPVASFDIKGFEARPISANIHKDPKKQDSTFEVVCPGKKTYQFIARTAKDMSQWVVAIGLANSLPTPTVPHRAPSIGQRRLPSIPQGEGEMYDDVGSSTLGSGQEDYEPVQSEEDEEIYHDIADMYQRRSDVPIPLPELKLPEQEPPIPPRRPVPLIPKDNSIDRESVYDDVGAVSVNNVYSNAGVTDMDMKPQESGHKEAESNQGGEEEEEEDVDDDEEEEDIYDDIGVVEQISDTKLSAFRRESSGRIQNIIKKMEQSIGNGNKPSIGYSPKCEPVKRVDSEELYEPIENGDVSKPTKLNDIRPRANLVR